MTDKPYSLPEITPFGLADSSLESTRVYWRERMGCPPDIVNDPRKLGEILETLSVRDETTQDS